MGLIKLKLALLCLSLAFLENLAAPADPAVSFVVSSTPTPPLPNKELQKKGDALEPQFTVPQITKMHILSKISNRFANTTITSKVKNIADKSQEATFAVVLPETAFISGFVMEVDGKNYTAYVKEKEEAKKDYDQAVASGIGAAHVAVSARDSNRFTVSVNIEPQTKAAFYLTYEQLLKRDDGHYEQIININPGQPVNDLSVEVVINESRKIVDLKAPPLRSGNEIGSDNSELDPRADIKSISDKEAVITFSPNKERQKQLAKILKTKEDEGFSGQFVVQYDVERDPEGGEILIQDGYFVHFFAPSELEPLPKHVIFVLDTSGSMYGSKMDQLKEAMNKILKELHPKDIFNLVEFNSNVRVWDLNTPNNSIWYPSNDYSWGQSYEDTGFDNYTFSNAYSANPDNIKKAVDTVNLFNSDGGTDILSAIKVGLHLVDLAKQNKLDDVERQTILVFLTDGEPTVRESSPEKITEKVTEMNSGSRKSPIFTLSFGRGADKKFLQKLSLRNRGFSKHIYEAADAALQLQDFYRQISSPLLADVTFKYEPSVTSLTTTEFPIHFRGSEIVVTGWCGTGLISPPTIDGISSIGFRSFRPTVQHTDVSNVERLWAYLTVRQLLEKKEVSDADKEELKKKALDLALKYSFVTPVSSLVVVKPNVTSDVNTEDASEGGSRVYPQSVSKHRTYAVKRKHPSIQLSQDASVNRISGYGGAGVSYHAISAQSLPGMYGPPPPNAYPLDSDSDALAGIPLIAGGAPAPTRVPFHRPLYTTTIPLIAPQNTTAANDLFAKLPWLKDILDNNGLLTMPGGKTLKLDSDETITDVVACPKTPLNESGRCTLLKDCPQAHALLTTADVFFQHSCVLKNEFAGICCPVS